MDVQSGPNDEKAWYLVHTHSGKVLRVFSKVRQKKGVA